MDIQMPEMDGYEAARTIRADCRADAKVIPIIAMAANAFEQDLKTAMEAEMDAHIAKPIDVNILYTTRREGRRLNMPETPER
ncbi:MAG: response regulator [[Clostridium] symbiosum]